MKPLSIIVVVKIFLCVVRIDLSRTKNMPIEPDDVQS